MKTTDNGNTGIFFEIALVIIAVLMVLIINASLLPNEAEAYNVDVANISVEETEVFSDEFVDAFAEYTEQYWLDYFNDHPYYYTESN